MMKAILFRFVALLFSLVFVALLGEIALRLFERHDGIIRRFDHDLGWVPLENVSQQGVHQNQFGLRGPDDRSEEHTSELQSRRDLVCRLLLEKKKKAREWSGGARYGGRQTDGRYW